MHRHQRRSRIVPAALGALLLAPLGAVAQQSDADWLERCDQFGWHHDQETHCEVRPVRVAASGALALEADNGMTHLTGAERRDVALRARISAAGDTEREARENAAAVRIVVNGSRVRASAPRGVRFAVDWIGEVPRAYDLELESQNGPVTVERVRGRLQVDAQNGPVRLDDVAGSVMARTQNGPLEVTVAERDIGADGIELESTNGPLELRLPSGVDARVEVSTTNGPLSLRGVDLEVRRRSRYGPAGSASGTLGSGGPLISASTQNGPLTLRQD